ncbi:MAG TPA: MFS transporter [Polyangiaceae bacterium]|nr:MFS transporter [Polyangiaceae bacterium]
MTLGSKPEESLRVAPGAAFQSRDFRWFQAARGVGVSAYQMQSVAIGWQVYALTGNALDLGFVGLAQFLPAVLLSLFTGHVADRYDRRQVILACYALLACASLTLALVMSLPRPSLPWVYCILTVVGCARAFSGPASQALMPNLVPPQHFTNAVAWSSGLFHVAVVLGPALGGLGYGVLGPVRLFVLCGLLELGALLLLHRVTPRPSRQALGRSFADLLAGLRFVWRQKLVLGAISLDLFAVLLGGAVALLPIFARDILHVGPAGLGVLRSAPAFGATLVALVLAFHPLRQRAGAALLGCVGIFGVATIGFGLSRSFLLSLTLLAIAGAADMVSVYIRHTLVQLNTPDVMRGRVAAVNLVFIGASNELGEFESGLTAAWLGAVPAVLLGGAGTCLIVVLWVFLFPELARTSRLDGRDGSLA